MIKGKIKQTEWYGDPTDKPVWWDKNRPLSEKEQKEAILMRQDLKNEIMALTLKRKLDN